MIGGHALVEDVEVFHNASRRLHGQAVLIGQLPDLFNALRVVRLGGLLNHLRGLELLDDLRVALEGLAELALEVGSSNGGRGRWPPPPSHDSDG